MTKKISSCYLYGILKIESFYKSQESQYFEGKETKEI